MEKLTKSELIEICKDLSLSYDNKLTKLQLTDLILKSFDDIKPLLDKKFIKYTDYNIYEQIGNKGKEGITYLVKNKDNNQFMAMKTFKKTKSTKRIEEEASLQRKASEIGIAPVVFEVNLEQRYIVMELMSEHLMDVMKEQDGNLTEKQQNDILDIFKQLDSVKVFHGDVNLMNYMYKYDGSLSIIDFGFSKPIDKTLIKKLNTTTPNFDLMTLGLVLKLKEMNCPSSASYYLRMQLSDENKTKFELHDINYVSNNNTEI